MRLLFLADGNIATVDKDLYENLSSYSWYTLNGYAIRREGGKIIYMHRQIMGEPEGIIDHINRRKLDNRRDNLRECNYSQNRFNTSYRVESKTGHRGITKEKGLYRARIMQDGERISLGYFTCINEAVKVYQSKAVELFGDFAGGVS